MSDPTTDRTETEEVNRHVKRFLRVGTVGLVSLQFVSVAAAHDGSLHTGPAHRLLLGGLLVGIGLVGSSFLLNRVVAWMRPRLILGGILTGLLLATISTIALIQIQVEPITTAPLARRWYPLVAILSGAGVMIGSLTFGQMRWRGRPSYTILGVLLGLWVAYPVLVPGSGLLHPLGYLVVASVALLVGYIGWRDVRPAVVEAGSHRLARLVGAISTPVFAVFFLFSSGLFSVNPDPGMNPPTTPVVTMAQFANPLVVWPAVEFYLPSIPLAGALSVGTALVIVILTGLVGVNSVLATRVWQSDATVTSSQGWGGAVATTGATACCCCGPALYGLASAVMGVAASPLYWAFIDPASPLGAVFFVGATGLLTGSAIRLSAALKTAGICAVASRT